MKNTKGLMIIALAFTLASCAAIPENIKGNNQPDIQKNFISVHNQPGLYTGQQARFGGKVINVINTKKDTLLEIAVLPLNDSAKPQIDASYQGRILAQQKGFLDPGKLQKPFRDYFGNNSRR
ncbi:lipoprotein [Citrobacter freundii]|nr:lipoprotein [Citrobacter freundii]